MLPAHPKTLDDPHFLALATQSSNLQTRLFATLDALTEVQRAHQTELDELQAQVDSLRAKSRALKRRAKVAEAERDKLKEDVDKLVEKDPMPVSIPSTSHADTNSHRDPYYSSVVNYLATALTAERQEFSNFKKTSEGRVATLEDQLARRDIELQKYILFPCTCRSQVPRGAPPRSRTSSGVLSKEQVRNALDQAAVRNRALEIEVQSLASKVEKAKTVSPERRQPSTTTPQLSEQVQTGNTLQLSPNLTRRSSHDPSSHTVLSDINQQIEGLDREIDGLQSERHNLAAMLDADHAQQSHPTSEDFQGVLLIEEECIRLRQAQRALRQELLLSKATATATEQELKVLVERLQRQVDELRNPEAEDSLLLGEQDMEVEDDAPVTEILNTPDHTTRTPTLPAVSSTPSGQQSPSLLAWVHEGVIPLRPPTAPPFRAQSQRLARIESELNQAREDVEKKDRSIEALRAQLEALGAAVHCRGDGDG